MATECGGNSAKLHVFQFCTRHREIFRANNSSWGRQIQICYLNFSGSKECFHGNQIYAKQGKTAHISAVFLYKIPRNISREQWGLRGGKFKFAI